MFRSLIVLFLTSVSFYVGCTSKSPEQHRKDRKVASDKALKDTESNNPRGNSGGSGTSGVSVGGTAQNIRRAVARVEAQNELKQLATIYQQHELLNGSPPSLKQLTAGLKTAPKILKRIQDKDYIVVTKGLPGGGKRIIAYTKGTYGDRHLAAFNDTSVSLVSGDEIKKLPKQ
ncbi:MAG: hypothetical protein ACFCD0_13895 [Gemmataceae bacterium]